MKYAAYLIPVVLVIFIVAGGNVPDDDAAHYGFYSLLPALITLFLVFLTREVISSLFIGIVAGGIISTNYNILDGFILPSIGSHSFAVILFVYLWCLGGLIGLWTRTGGAQYFARWAARRIVKGPRTAKFFAWLMGVVFHQGGTISTVLTGTTIRAITDSQRVSHEEVSYIVDSTASPIATVIPLNVWPIYVGGLLVGTIPIFATEQQVVSFFFGAVAFNFYGIFAVIFTLLFALEVLPWEGRKMRAARKRSRETGELNRPDATPLAAAELSELKVPSYYKSSLADFFIPLGILIGVAMTGIIPALVAGDISRISVPIAEAFGLSVLGAVITSLIKGMKLQSVINGFVDGIKGVTIGAIILALAVSLGEVSRTLGTAAYIINVTAHLIHPVFLPLLFLIINMGVAFSVGTSWGTYAVVFPIAMPLAYAVNPDSFFLTLCFGAVLGGAVFGDQCSPISDTTILSSLATGADLMDHVLTQLPLAIAAASLAGICYTILVFLFV